MKVLLEFIRGLVRPYVMYSGWAVVLYMVLTQKPIPDFLLAFISALTGWTYAERALSHRNGGTPNGGG